MMLENQMKMNGPPGQTQGSQQPQQPQPQSQQQQQQQHGGPTSQTPSNAQLAEGQRSRGESIAIDPLQPDPMQLMELFPGDVGMDGQRHRGSIGAGNLDDLVGFNGDLNLMNGF